MIIISEFFFFFFYFFLKLYSLVNKHFILSNSGDKLKKYIKNLQNIADNFDIANILNFKKLFLYYNKISPNLFKHLFCILFISLDILIIKLNITYKFLTSNTLFIKFLNKNIELSSILNKNYYIFKVSYYFLFYFFILNILIKNYLYFIQKNLNSKKNKSISDNSINLNIAKVINENEQGLKKENLIIKENGMYQNILITGSIGSGKTSGAISNILDKLIKNNIGGLIIDIKGNYYSDVFKIAKKYNKYDDVIKISIDNEFKYNPLNQKGLSSIELSNIMKKVLMLLANQNTNSDPFWLDKAEEYIRDFITLIKVYNDNFVNCKEIHKLVSDSNYLNEKLKVIKFKILKNEFSDKELFEINNAILNINNDYLNLDQRTFGIIRSEITRMTSVFISNFNIYNKFCSKGNDIDFSLVNIYVLRLDLSNNNQISKIIATYMKLDFQRKILNNFKKKIPVFFLCDEYQEICNSEDANFFSLSREKKCINVISMQSYSSLNNTLKNESVSNVIIQNFVNKIWFRNDDVNTLKSIISFIGKKKEYNKSHLYSENGRNVRYNKVFNKFISYKSDITQSYSETKSIQNRYNEEFFTKNLKTYEAMCVISNGEKIRLYEKVLFKRWEDDINEN